MHRYDGQELLGGSIYEWNVTKVKRIYSPPGKIQRERITDKRGKRRFFTQSD